VAADGGHVAPGDGAGEALGEPDRFDVVEGSPQQRHVGFDAVGRGFAEVAPQVGRQLDDGGEIVAGDGGRCVVEHLVVGAEIDDLALQRPGHLRQHGFDRLFGFDAERGAGQVGDGLLDSRETLAGVDRAHVRALLARGIQGLHRARAAAVDGDLPLSPLQPGAHRGDMVVGGGDKNHLGGIRHGLVLRQHPAAGYQFGEPFGRCRADVGDGGNRVAFFGESHPEGGADGAGADET